MLHGVASTDSAAFIAWDDTRNSVGDTQAQDILFRPRPVPDPQAVFATGSTPTKANHLVCSLLGAAVAPAEAGLVLLGAQRLRRPG